MSDSSSSLPIPPGFSLRGVALSHGWYALAPYRWDDASGALHRVEELPSGAVCRVRVVQRGDRLLVETGHPVSTAEADELIRRIRWCLRLDEDLSEFTRLCADDPALCEAVAPSGGRLLRCPTLWEDIVKTILTTNTTWAQTKTMAHRLVSVLGSPRPEDPSARAFPSPGSVARNEEALVTQVRLGYRNASVLRIARDIAEGRLDPEEWKQSKLATPELRKQLLSLPGVGPYAAATLLMILGRYDELAIDTALRSHVRRKYFSGEPAPEAQMRAVYERWGRWRYLAYWFDPS